MLGVDEKKLTNSAKNGTEAKTRNGRQEEAGSWEHTRVREIVERKRTMKPPEKTLTNDEYRKLRREGLEKDHAASAPNPTRANPKNEMMQMK